MSYPSLRHAVRDLERTGQLVRVTEEVDPNLEMAEIHRRVFTKGGPAILFEQVKGSPFQALSNLYGTNERAEYLFRDTLARVQKVVSLKADLGAFFKRPRHYASAPFTALTALPWKTRFAAKSTYGQTTIDQLPQVVSWPDDGGAFITLPQVLTQPPGDRNIMRSNLGMYRIQLSGGTYLPNVEIGMHYQLHRGIGVHHKAYLEVDQPFRASIFVGGPPSHALAAIFPLPEGLSELTFAGMLGDRRFRYHQLDGYVVSNDADFVITGTIAKRQLKPEGPFGDHLGYYSLKHDFPVFTVDKVYHRQDPLWHFTVVGRPPQEDSGFGYLIHRLVSPLVNHEFPGVKEINAVDVAGVHPLLLALGSERYMPFRSPQPEEILTQANRILGSGQTSLAKFLVIAAEHDVAPPSTREEMAFLHFVLERIDWRRDLHFQTNTTIDTLDYSGSGWNAGSKVVMACYGPKQRILATELPQDLSLPGGVTQVDLVAPGILAIQAQPFQDYQTAAEEIQNLMDMLVTQSLVGIALITLADDVKFLGEHSSNFLWATFTRANPAKDIYGIGAKTYYKHWGCTGPLIIDARIKPHHAPPLLVDEQITRQVDRLFSARGSLAALG